MTALVLSALDLISRRLHDPRRWVQGTYAGIRRNGRVVPFNQHGQLASATCWCLSTAITLAVTDVVANTASCAWTELRSDVERVLLESLELATGERWAAIAHWNDDLRTSFQDVWALVAGTYCRLLAERGAN